MPIGLSGFEYPFLADPAKKDWFGPRLIRDTVIKFIGGQTRRPTYRAAPTPGPVSSQATTYEPDDRVPYQYAVPRWKVENPNVANCLIGVCKRWKERSGCDGFRIDSAQLQPVSFWLRFDTDLKAAPPGGHS
jgi:glycosidase